MCSKASFRADQIHFGMRFADLMCLDPKSGRPSLDFSLFDTLIEPAGLMQLEPVGPPPVGVQRLVWENDRELPGRETPGVFLAYGCTRASYGGSHALDGNFAKMPLVPTCYFSQSIALMLAEAGVEFRALAADLLDKPDWLAEVDPKSQASPVLRLAVEGEPGSVSVAELSDEIPEPAGPPAPGVPRLASGSARLSYGEAEIDAGAPPGPLTPMCPYCKRLGLLLGEAEVEFELVQIDLTDGRKPKWFTDAYAPGEVPAVQGLPGFGAPGTWQGGFEDCVQAFARVYPRVGAVLDRPCPVTPEAMLQLAEGVIYTGAALLAVGTRLPPGRGALQFMATSGFYDAPEAAGRVVEDSDSDEPARLHRARVACKERAMGQLHEICKRLEDGEARGGFLGGERPAFADTWLGPALQFVKAMLETGFLEVGQAAHGPEALDRLGLGVVNRYLDRWTRRPGWALAYKATHAFNAAGLRSMISRIRVPDVMTAEVLDPIFARARAMDPRYRALTAPPAGAGPRQWIAGSEAIVAACCRTLPAFKALMDKEPLTDVDVGKINVGMGFVGLSLAPSKYGSGTRTFILGLLGIDVKEPRDVVGECRDKVLEMLTQLEAALGDNAFFCGDSPGGVDCKVGPPLEFGSALLRLGVCELGADFEDLAPRLHRYLERWAQRSSWKTHLWGSPEARAYAGVAAIRLSAQKAIALAPDLEPVYSRCLLERLAAEEAAGNEHVATPRARAVRRAGGLSRLSRGDSMARYARSSAGSDGRSSGLSSAAISARSMNAALQSSQADVELCI